MAGGSPGCAGTTPICPGTAPSCGSRISTPAASRARLNASPGGGRSPSSSPSGAPMDCTSSRIAADGGTCIDGAGGAVEAVVQRAAEMGEPPWLFGISNYAFSADGEIVLSYREDGRSRLALLRTDTGALEPIETPYTEVSYLRAQGGRVCFLGSSPTEFPSVVTLDLGTRKLHVLRRSSEVKLDSGYVSVAEPIEFPTANGLTAFGFFYAPKNRDYVGPDGERPPLIVMSHGGPTSAADGQPQPRGPVLEQPRFRRPRCQLRRQQRLRPRLSTEARRPVGHRRRRRLRERRPVSGRAWPGGRRAPGDPGWERGRLHDARGAHLPGCLQGRRQPLRRQRSRGDGARIRTSSSRATSNGSSGRIPSEPICTGRAPRSTPSSALPAP